jgi:hypothetical protein
MMMMMRRRRRRRRGYLRTVLNEFAKRLTCYSIGGYQ